LGIRSRLLLLTLGVAVPLMLVGVLGLRLMWNLSREQLDDSVKQQAELAAVAFERWVDAQRQPLTTLAELSATEDVRSPAFAEHLRATVSTRRNWIDLRVVDSSGRPLITQPAGRDELPSALTDFLLEEMRRRDSWVVVTDRTRDEVRPVFAIAAPRAGGGAVIARVDGVAMHELFRDIELSTRSVIAVFDGERRVLYQRIAAAVARGLSNKEIAAECGISVRTVENHISHILSKKSFSNRVEIARHWIERGQGK